MEKWRVDDFWLFLFFCQTCLFDKKNKKKRKKEKRVVYCKKKKILYIIFLNQSQYIICVNKKERTRLKTWGHPNKYNFYYLPVVSIIWNLFKCIIKIFGIFDIDIFFSAHTRTWHFEHSHLSLFKRISFWQCFRKQSDNVTDACFNFCLSDGIGMGTESDNVVS